MGILKNQSFEIRRICRIDYSSSFTFEFIHFFSLLNAFGYDDGESMTHIDGINI